MNVDFGPTATDYSRHRAGFPPQIYTALEQRGLTFAGRTLLDLGSGTGTLARGCAERGARAVGLDIAPAMLQVELHPYLTQEKLLRFCAQHDIHVTGFSPLGAQSYFAIGMAEEGEGVIDREETKAIAAEVGKTPAQVVLRWGIQRGTSIVPKTSRLERLKENLDLFDFELTDQQMNTLSALNQNRRFNDPGDFGEKAFNTFFPIYE